MNALPATAAATGSDVAFPAVLRRRQAAVALAFAGLSVALGVVAFLVGVPASLLPFVLALGPTVVAIALAALEGEGAVRRLLRLAIRRPVRRSWYLVLVLPVAWALSTVVIAIILGQPTVGLFDQLFPAIVIVPLVVLLPAFAEEIAWRGYAVSRLLPSMSPSAAAIALAGPWIVLHLLLQMPGQMNAGLAVWPTVVSLVSYSVILAWVFVGSGGSVLIAALLHAGFNGVAPLMRGVDVDRAWAIRAVLVAAIAIAVVARERRPAAALAPRPAPADAGVAAAAR